MVGGFAGMGGLMELMGHTSFDNPGLNVSSPGSVKSLVTSKNNTIAGENTLVRASDYFYNDSLLPLMKDYELTKSIIGIFSGTLSDVLSKAEFKIGGTKHDEEVTDFIKKINIKKYIIDNLDDALYYGQFAFCIDYVTESIRELLNPYDYILIKVKGKPHKYQLSTDLYSRTGDNEIDSLVDHKMIGSISFNTKVVFKKNSGLNKLKYDNQYLVDQIVDITYHKGTCILYDVLCLLFEHFLKSLLRTLLSIKETIRPEIIVANVANNNAADKQIDEVIANIESLLNNGECNIDLRAQNAGATIAQLMSTIMNNVKVVPGLQNYTNLENLQYASYKDKIDSLKNETDDLKTKIINNVGIPDELFTSGSNRWEILSRSTRYLSIINSLLVELTACVKQVSLNYLNLKYPDEELCFEDIDFNLNDSNAISNNNFNAKVVIVSETLDKLGQILSTVEQLANNEAVNKDKMLTYIANQLSSLDENLGQLVNIKGLLKREDPQESELDSSEKPKKRLVL